MKPLIYFVCTGNACRSQMAEGFARALAGGRFEAASGGLQPSSVDPRAIRAMAEVGVDISGQASKGIDPEILFGAAVVVTLCGDAEERCPITPPHVRRLHWPLPDPARARGDAEEAMGVFRSCRDEIREKMLSLLADLERSGMGEGGASV